MALLSGDEEPVLVAEALQRLGLDVKEMVEAPEVPPVRLAENLEGKIWQTAMETRRLVEMAWVAESQQVIEAGSSLASQLVPETDELLQSLITRKVPDAPETEADGCVDMIMFCGDSVTVRCSIHPKEAWWFCASISEPALDDPEKEDEKNGDYYSWTATMDLGPIKYKGIKFTDIQLDRYHRQKGSSFYFLELPMPMGVSLEEVEVDGVGTVIQVTDLVDGGSAKEDGSIRVGDYLRAITTPQRKLTGGEEGEEGGMAEALGASAGEQTKAVLVIPRGFPFQRVIDEIAENNKMDSYVGLVFERPFVDQD
ncbi:unnamed protein product [Durusdinium trenchii]|uniref:PDZ domain-containing protein n=1 Tax=Durusdinium trenchii TaxID=1381693 RepID=A0ABP0S0S8_9DINO